MPESVVAAPVAEVKPPVAAAPAAPAAPVAAPAAAPAPAAPAAGLLGAEPAADAPAAPDVAALPSYEFKLPDGVTVNDELMGQFKGIAAELKLPVEQAQAIMDMGLKLQEQQSAAISEAWQAERIAEAERLQADPDFGGAKFAATCEAANRALRQYADAEFIQQLRDLGMDNNAGLVKLLARVGRATAEDRSIDRPGSGIPSSDRSLGEVLYPNQGKA